MRKVAVAQRGPRVGSFAEEPGLIYDRIVWL